MTMFCPTKDKIPELQKSNVVYCIDCPGCNQSYVGKTDRCLFTCLKEHGSRTEQPMYQHLINCDLFHESVAMLNVLDSNVNEELHIYNAVFNNYRILAINHHWSQLEFLEAYYIKERRLGIKELQLFR